MVTIETLEKFCGEHGPVWIETPWSEGGYTYATEGHVILRVPMVHGVAEKEIKQIKPLPWEELDKPVKWRLRPEVLTEARKGFLCEHCKWDGNFGLECDECAGTRWSMEVVWQLAEGYFVAPWLLQKMVDALGVIEFMEPSEGIEAVQRPPVGFRFHGGAGLLMPMRRNSRAVVVNKERRTEGL